MIWTRIWSFFDHSLVIDEPGFGHSHSTIAAAGKPRSLPREGLAAWASAAPLCRVRPGALGGAAARALAGKRTLDPAFTSAAGAAPSPAPPNSPDSAPLCLSHPLHKARAATQSRRRNHGKPCSGLGCWVSNASGISPPAPVLLQTSCHLLRWLSSGIGAALSGPPSHRCTENRRL